MDISGTNGVTQPPEAPKEEGYVPPTKKCVLVRNAMLMFGRTVTLNQLNQHLLQERGVRVSYVTFEKHYHRLFTTEGEETHQQRESTPLPPVNYMDGMSDFVRFVAAVEACGGLTKAKKFLALLEGLSRAVG